MQPLTPEERAAILRRNPQAAPEDIEEYEYLLASRFTVDPSRPMPSDRPGPMRSPEDRLQELYNKLFRE
jgi:hypothetical protein